MPSFVQPALLWGLLLVGVPLAIHLLNLVRQRRVEWAAMEFLLASQRRSHRSVLLRQFLLLALRMLAIAAVVLLLAQPLVRTAWSAALGGTRTHHVVLLDDSYSMLDRGADTTVFQRALDVIRRLGDVLETSRGSQTLTVLRFSQVTSGTPRFDLQRAGVDENFAARVKSVLAELHASASDPGPAEALEAVRRLAAEQPQDAWELILLSDFRQRPWQHDRSLAERLEQLSALGLRMHLVDCAAEMHGNLGIVSLEPVGSVRATGVPMSWEVAVKNFGDAPVRNVAVALSEDGVSRPALALDEIPAGRAVTRRFSVAFPTAGQHSLEAALDADAVETDNRRSALVEVPEAVPVLIVDGGAELADGRYVARALAPGGNIRTGLAPRVEPPGFLVEESLEPFAVIFLLNVADLSPPAWTALERFATHGGGLVVFAGENTTSESIQRLQAAHPATLFPAPFLAVRELAAEDLSAPPDLEVTDHPVFRVFAGERNSFLRSVAIERYVALPDDWQPASETAVQVIARLRGGAPLALEHRWGDGRVITFLTTAAPSWNNWARNPSYVITLLELQAYLAQVRQVEVAEPVGRPVQLGVDPARYQSSARFRRPNDSAGSETRVDATTTADGLQFSFPQTDMPGLYTVELVRTDEQVETRRFARNPPSEEGDLHQLTEEALRRALPGVTYSAHAAEAFPTASRALAGANSSPAIWYLLFGVLLVEQWLGWLASYHPRKGGG